MSTDTPRLTCRDLIMRASEYIDGELQAPQHQMFEEHQERCPGCRGTVTSLKRTVEGIRGLTHEAEAPRLKTLLNETMQRLKGNRT